MVATIIKPRLRNILFSLLIISAVFLPFSGTSLGQKSVAKAAGSTSLVISAIKTIGENGDPKNQAVELYNPTAAAITMTDWRLNAIKRKGNNNVVTSLVAPLNGVVQSHGWFIIANQNGYIGTYSMDIGYSNPDNLLENDSTVVLSSDGGHVLVDKVGYGAAPDFETSPFPTNPDANSVLYRLPPAGSCHGGSIDTDNNSRDFTLSPLGCFANTTGVVGDVVNTPEDGSWDTDHLIDFPGGKVSDEEQALKDKAQTAMHWWENAFSTASINCPPAGHPAKRGGVVYWDLRSIMKKACWITDITTLNLVTGNFVVTGHDPSLLNELYTTYWPDLATSNKAKGTFVGTQAWIGTALVNGLAGPGQVGPDGVTHPSPPTVDALFAVLNAGWGIEADRLLAVFQSMPDVLDGSLAFAPSDRPWGETLQPDEVFFLCSLYIPVTKIPFVGPFILKVTKIPGILIMKSVGTSFTYVVKVLDAALAKRLTNKALSTAGTEASAELDKLVVQKVENRGSQATNKLILKRNKSTAAVNWKVEAEDAITRVANQPHIKTVVTVGDAKINTLIYKTGGPWVTSGAFVDGASETLLYTDVNSAMHGTLVFNLSKMFANTDLEFAQQREVATAVSHLLDTMLGNPLIGQGVPNGPKVIQQIADKIVIDDDIFAWAMADIGSPAWVDEDTGIIHIALKYIRNSSFLVDIKFDVTKIQVALNHEVVHVLNRKSMGTLGTLAPVDPYVASTTIFSGQTKRIYSPIDEGLTEKIAALSYGPKSRSLSYLVEHAVVDKLIANMEKVYQAANPALTATQVHDAVYKSVINAYIKYGSQAFDKLINTNSGPFSAQELFRKIVDNEGFVQGLYNTLFPFIDSINIKSINIIPPATF